VKVAVVGAGISGLATAYLLRGRHEVALFEREDRPGGHANTVAVRAGEGELGVDTGFVVYNETTYPGFSALLRELDVPTQPSDMSFSCSCARCGIEYSSYGLGGLFADIRAVVRPSHLRLLPDLLAFYRRAARMLEDGSADGLTLGDEVRRMGPGRAIAAHYLVPMAAAIWSTPPREILDFPLHYLLRFLHNHGLIGWGRTLQWRTVTGGSREYVRRLVAALPAGTLRVGRPAVSVRRTTAGVEVATVTGAECFDAVVLACHANEALALLGDPSQAEREALGSFSYTENRVVLHRDPRLLPAKRRARASWNVAVPDCRAPGESVTMTYLMNRLQSLPGRTAYCASVNPPETLRQSHIIQAFTYAHPRYTSATLTAQRATEALQGERRTYFAGAHLGYGFHEDGYQSAARVAALLGARP
jgi:predicted NAD/FAD-binding protein